MDHRVMGGGHRSLAHLLTHQEEIIATDRKRRSEASHVIVM